MNTGRTASPVAAAGRLILPREHGSWSLALEPVVLGLVAAPTGAGVGVAVAALAGMFLRRPAKVLAGDRADERRAPAIGSVVLLGLAAAAGLGAAGWSAGAARLWPLLLAVPPGLLFLWLDARGEARAAAAELAGATAFALVPAAIASMAGWPATRALALAAVMAGRSLPAVTTIRAFLRRRKGAAVAPGPAVAAGLAAVAVAGGLAWAGLAPWAAPAVLALLLGRTVFLLRRPALAVSATQVGVAESAVGGILVLILALSWSG